MNALVAGFGNMFLSDDGFGPAVLRMLMDGNLGSGVRARDFGTGGMHLALEMLEGYDLVIIVDAIARDAPPGTLFAIDCTAEDVPPAAPDAHEMSVASVLALFRTLAERTAIARSPQIVLAGCVPQNLEEGMDLSEPVRAALPAAVDLVRRLTQQPIVTGAER